MTHTVTAPQPAPGLSSPPQTIPCPARGFRGPHQPIHGTHLECGRLPLQVGPRTHLGGCGYSWPISFEDTVIPTDPIIERLIDLIDAAPDIGIVDTPHGAILEWRSALDIARGIAGDHQLRQLMTSEDADEDGAA